VEDRKDIIDSLGLHSQRDQLVKAIKEQILRKLYQDKKYAGAILKMTGYGVPGV